MRISITEYLEQPVKFTPQIVSIKLQTEEEFNQFKTIFKCVAGPSSSIDKDEFKRVQALAKNIHDALLL